MAKATRSVEIVGEGAAFIIRQVNGEGKVMDADTFHTEKPLADNAVGQFLSQEFKTQGTRRSVFQSVLGHVMADPRLDGFKGTADKATGKTSKEFRAAVRDAEASYLRRLVDKNLVKIPKEVGDGETGFQKFATSVREDKNYSNVKATVMRYFAIVGARPVTASGYLVPVPVMQAELQNIADANRQPTDNSYRAQIAGIMDALNKDTKPDPEDIAKAAREAKLLLSTLEGIVSHYAELAQTTGNVAAATAASIAKAADPKATGKAKKAEEVNA